MSLSYRNLPARLFYRFILWPAETLLLAVVLGFIALLNIRGASFIFGSLFALIGPLTPWHRRAEQQLQWAIPALNADERTKILKGMWQNLGRNLGEYPKLEAMLKGGYIQFDGLEHLQGNDGENAPIDGPIDGQENGQEKKGGFIIGAHLGNWEALAMIGPHLGLKTGLIFRPLNNPYISFLLNRRASTAEADIYQKGREAAMGMISTVRKGGYMMILADQQLREGEEVAFFGHPAKTAIAHFKIAAKSDVPIYYAQTIRHDGCQIQVKLSAPVQLAKTASDTEILAAAVEMNKNFEAWIRTNPEQWLWPHRRWGKALRK